MRFSLQIYLGVLTTLLLYSSGSAQEEDLVNGKYCNSLCRKWMGLPEKQPLELHSVQSKVEYYKPLTINRRQVLSQQPVRSYHARGIFRFGRDPLNNFYNIDSDYFECQPRDKNDIIPLIEARRFLLHPDVKSENPWGLAGLKPIEEGFSTILGLSRSAFGGLVRPLFDTAALKHAVPNNNSSPDHNRAATPHE